MLQTYKIYECIIYILERLAITLVIAGALGIYAGVLNWAYGYYLDAEYFPMGIILIMVGFSLCVIVTILNKD